MTDMRNPSRLFPLLIAAMGVFETVAASAQTSVAPAADYETATATMAVPQMVDDTDSIMYRDRIIEPPAGVFVVPNQFVRNFIGRRGPKFVAQNDLIDELFGGCYFPGPPESGLTPGDPNVAVGPSHVIAVINGRLSFYSKSGSQTFTASPNSFFSGLGISYGLVFDCRCLYDQYSQRFWIMYDSYDTGRANSYFLIAVSDDSNPNGTWSKWALNASLNGDTHSNKWADYPGFGYDQDVIMVTANMYPISGSGVYGKIRVMEKGQFLAGSPTITWTDFWNMSNPSGGTAYSLQPARHLGDSVLPMLANVSSGRCNVWAIQNPLTSPALQKRGISVSSFNSAPGGVQKGTSVLWDTLDSRIYDVACRDNEMLVTHNVSGGGGCQARWYHVDVSGMPSSASMIQNGNIAGESGEYVGYAALQMNQNGTIGTGVTKSSSDEYISLYYTGRQPSDPAGTMHPLTLQLAGTRSYTGEGGGTVRWGDYVGGAVDPYDDTTFWAIGMLPGSSSGYWKTEIYSYTIGAPPALLAGRLTIVHYDDPTGLSTTLEFREPGTQNVVHSYPITVLDTIGNFEAGAVAEGTWDIAIKFSHWLRCVLSNVPIAAGDNYIQPVQLNGDAVPVDLLDINAILSLFGTADPQVDLDGSGLVDVNDLNIVVIGFGMIGDP
jgi:hypothetical protein